MGQLFHMDMGYTQARFRPPKDFPGSGGHGGALSLAPQMVRLALLSSMELGLGTEWKAALWGEVSPSPLFMVLGAIPRAPRPFCCPKHYPTSSLSPVAIHPPPGLQVEEVEGIGGPIPSSLQRGVSGYSGSYSNNSGCTNPGF